MKVPDETYRTPLDLRVTPTELRRVLVVGSCLLRDWPRVIEPSEMGCPCDFVLINNSCSLPAAPPRAMSEYSFQLVQLPLRTVVPDRSYFRLEFSDIGAYERLLTDAERRLASVLRNAMSWNTEHGVLTFVFNFQLPQANPMGRLLPRYDLRNMVYFVERLNECLAAHLRSFENAFLFDYDQVVATFGRKYVCDDAVWQVNHGSVLEDSNHEMDRRRLQQVARIGRYYPLRVQQIRRSAWNELVAMYRTVVGADMVKLVVVDIDDTLWRGVTAEGMDHGQDEVEGWPLGVIEALGYLKRRGILLALMSRGDERLIAEKWERTIYSRRLSFDDFTAIKINWSPKSQNCAEILRETNTLPGSTIVIDDNPVERAALCASLPGLRVFGPNPYLWRRILLWSPETQATSVSQEASQRSETLKSRIRRDRLAVGISREEFLANLHLQLEGSSITDVSASHLPRVLELINRTNQFNTTGRRWTRAEIKSALHEGAILFAFEAKDRFVDYGMICAAVVQGSVLLQFVMSCRVMGLDIEIAALAAILQTQRNAGVTIATAHFVDTPLNAACRDFYLRAGFTVDSSGLQRNLDLPMAAPTHIATFGPQEMRGCEALNRASDT